jgi:radical SAM-linked protein
MQRFRLTYARTSALRYTGHLDMQIVWERSLRRARLPLMYSQGFHPQPRINQACPLPLGMTSRMEIMDFWLDPDIPTAQVESMLTPALPPGIEPTILQEVDLHLPALQTQVVSARFHATLLIPFDPAELKSSVLNINQSPTLPRIRREKAYDLRPLIFSLETLQTDLPDRPHLFMHLSARDGATGRPEEVLSALGLDPLDVRVERTQLIFLGE